MLNNLHCVREHRDRIANMFNILHCVTEHRDRIIDDENPVPWRAESRFLLNNADRKIRKRHKPQEAMGTEYQMELYKVMVVH